MDKEVQKDKDQERHDKGNLIDEEEAAVGTVGTRPGTRLSKGILHSVLLRKHTGTKQSNWAPQLIHLNKNFLTEVHKVSSTGVPAETYT